MTDNPLPPPSPPALPEAQRLPGILARYRDPKLAWSLTEIAVTLAPLVALWAAMWALMHVSYWLSLALALPAAGFLVRLFLIQHDCGHGALFRHRAINDWVGRVFGVVTLTPYDYWKRTHATHHATAGNLDRRGLGDIVTLTVERIPGSELAQAPRLLALSPSPRDVRPRARLPFPAAASRPARPHARGLEALDFDDVDQFQASPSSSPRWYG